MNIEEKHKGEIVAEVLEKKLSDHLAERRCPLCTITAGGLHQVTSQLAAYNTRLLTISVLEFTFALLKNTEYA